jgi:hypothetical protein
MDPISARMVMAAAGAGAASAAVYVEDVFSTFLYEGNGSTQTITNGIDLSGEGGMVWVKNRSTISDNAVTDTERGATSFLQTNSSVSPTTNASSLTSFNSDGFSLGSFTTFNSTGGDFASWTFRKAPGFFDVVTYTGDGNSGRTVAHNLGSAPGMIWIKKLDNTDNWAVYHRGPGATQYGILNDSDSFATSSRWFNDTEPTSTQFTLGQDVNVNQSGASFVAYLFAHDDAADGLIQCGSYTGNGSTTGPIIDLGWEPQWLLIKRADAANTGSWYIFDTARGIIFDSADTSLRTNTSNAEVASDSVVNLTSTGFQLTTTDTQYNRTGSEHIYMAIRRPDKAPAAGTDFFQVRTRNGTGAAVTSSIDFNADLGIVKFTGSSSIDWNASTRGLIDGNFFETNTSNALSSAGNRLTVRGDEDSSVTYGTNSEANATSQPYVDYFWKRARGAFDTVFYTGTGAVQAIDHGLGVVPKMIWTKRLSSTGFMYAYHEDLGNTEALSVGSTSAASTSSTWWGNTSPTSTQFTVSSSSVTGANNDTYVAYLFGNVPGVIDIGSYTGTGVAGLQIDCGFSAGARFVVLKRTDVTGSWYVFDTARGIVTGTDTAAISFDSPTTQPAVDYLDPYSLGFEISSTLGGLNASGGTYIYMAIA